MSTAVSKVYGQTFGHCCLHALVTWSDSLLCVVPGVERLVSRCPWLRRAKRATSWKRSSGERPACRAASVCLYSCIKGQLPTSAGQHGHMTLRRRGAQHNRHKHNRHNA